MRTKRKKLFFSLALWFLLSCHLRHEKSFLNRNNVKIIDFHSLKGSSTLSLLKKSERSTTVITHARKIVFPSSLMNYRSNSVMFYHHHHRPSGAVPRLEHFVILCYHSRVNNFYRQQLNECALGTWSPAIICLCGCSFHVHSVTRWTSCGQVRFNRSFYRPEAKIYLILISPAIKSQLTLRWPNLVTDSKFGCKAVINNLRWHDVWMANSVKVV